MYSSGQAQVRTLKAQLFSSGVLWAILWTGSPGDPWLGEAGGRLASVWHFLISYSRRVPGVPISFLTC